MSKLLEVRGLKKTYPSGLQLLRVLRGIDFTLEKGDMVAVTGNSGSGKSTLLHLMGGLEDPDNGEIIFRGRSITHITPAEKASWRNLNTGFVFQFHHLLPEFSAVENVMFPLLLRRKSFRDARIRAMELLDSVGLADRAVHKPGELSGGEQQRVAIARALSGKPAILFGDEPTGNLDRKTSEHILELLLKVHREFELASVIVTHDPGMAAICHSVKRLENGLICSAEF
jgi:lipoprotein-releasing system ATP-binding protein